MSAIGRPTKYLPDVHPRLAEAWSAAGKTDVEIAEKLGIGERTLNEWKLRHPAFQQSIQRGKADPDDQVERSLFHRALGYTHPHEEIFCHQGEVTRVPTLKHYPPDTAAAFIWLKNRRPERWRDKIEVSTSDDQPTPEAIRARAEAIVGRLEQLKRMVLLCPSSATS